jgi:hypothetical protein
MESTEKFAAVAYLRKEKDASTGKHANHRAAPGCSLCTNPYYRNRTHRRSYYEEENVRFILT